MTRTRFLEPRSGLGLRDELLGKGDCAMNESSTEESVAPRRPRILFVAEAVTLAHVARPAALALGLDRSRYDVMFAVDPRAQRFVSPLGVPLLPLHSIPSDQFLENLRRGAPVYDLETLRVYLRDDSALIAEQMPDLVVGDFRLSLAISARVAKVPYFTITNAYWSPHAHVRFPLPDLPMVRLLGAPLAAPLFRMARPMAFMLHTLPMERLRREHGLPALGHDLRRVYTDADQVLFADVPELVPAGAWPANCHFLGPILWSPAVPPPDWWTELPTDRPVIYVTAGSSGSADLLSIVLEGLANEPVTVIAATAGRARPDRVPPNARVEDYLPGEAAAAWAALVICNGGSPATQQALAAGTPVIGLASNMDQHLNMAAIERAGAGRLLRAERVTPGLVRETTAAMLGQSSFRTAAKGLQEVLARYPAQQRFRQIVDQTLGIACDPADS